MIDDLAARFGGRVVRTPVGEAHVADAMLQTGAVIGGEGNGGVIDPRLGPVRDSFVAMALLLELLAQTQKTVSELVAEIPAYVMLKKKFPATRQQAAQWVEQARREFAGARMDLQDGVRIDQPEGWLHVRPSNTEPLVRVIAEAVDQAAAEQLLRRVQH
jgi:phosphomannomutase